MNDEMTKDPTIRAAFEQWYSDEWESPAAVERNGKFGYRYAGAQAAWVAWQAAAEHTECLARTVRVIHTWASVPGALKAVDVLALTEKALSLRPNTALKRPGTGE
jgi:malate synthase